MERDRAWRRRNKVAKDLRNKPKAETPKIEYKRVRLNKKDMRAINEDDADEDEFYRGS